MESSAVPFIYLQSDYGAPMMIKSVQVNKLFNEFDYIVNMAGALTFLHSPNGYGKTTLMHMIFSALRGDVKYLQEVPFERMVIAFDDESFLIVDKSGGEMRLLVQKFEVDYPLTPEEMAEVAKATYIPPERLVIKKRDGHLASALETYAQELYEHVRYAKEHRELVEQPSEGREEMTDGELEFWAKDLKAKLDFIKDAGFEPDLPPRYRFPPSRYDLSTNREGYEGLIHSIAEYVDRNYPLAESIIVFKDIVNDIFINKTLTISDAGKIGIYMQNGTALQLQKLSSGEKQILIMFYILLFHTEPESIVILDEPEISLHVSWQQKLGSVFQDICRTRGIQMIVATHSPQVIHDKWDLARELRVNNA